VEHFNHIRYKHISRLAIPRAWLGPASLVRRASTIFSELLAHRRL